MVDMIAKLTKRRSRALRVQVGDPGIWGRARPLMGMAEGLCDKAPPPPRGPPSSGPLRSWVSCGLEQDISQTWRTPPFFPLSFSKALPI